MVISYNFANDLIEKIEEKINDCAHKDIIQIHDLLSYSETVDFKWLWKTQNFSLPITTLGATNVLAVTKGAYEIVVNRWKTSAPKLVGNSIEETVNSMLEKSYPEEFIFNAIRDKISNLIYQYDKVLKITKKSNGLFGIKKEKKILLIHLRKYNEILDSDSNQIEHFHGITLNKEISDLLLEIYVRFIRLRLDMINPALEDNNNNNPKVTKKKITWKGSQRDLCELFIELQDKGWIDEFKYGERFKISTAICQLFDLRLTQKGIDSNVDNSFYQILKGEYDRETKKRDFSEILGGKDERKFDEIKYNGA